MKSDESSAFFDRKTICQLVLFRVYPSQITKTRTLSLRVTSSSSSFFCDWWRNFMIRRKRKWEKREECWKEIVSVGCTMRYLRSCDMSGWRSDCQLFTFKKWKIEWVVSMKCRDLDLWYNIYWTQICICTSLWNEVRLKTSSLPQFYVRITHDVNSLQYMKNTNQNRIAYIDE